MGVSIPLTTQAIPQIVIPAGVQQNNMIVVPAFNIKTTINQSIPASTTIDVITDQIGAQLYLGYLKWTYTAGGPLQLLDGANVIYIDNSTTNHSDSIEFRPFGHEILSGNNFRVRNTHATTAMVLTLYVMFGRTALGVL